MDISTSIVLAQHSRCTKLARLQQSLIKSMAHSKRCQCGASWAWRVKCIDGRSLEDHKWQRKKRMKETHSGDRDLRAGMLGNSSLVQSSGYGGARRMWKRKYLSRWLEQSEV